MFSGFFSFLILPSSKKKLFYITILFPHQIQNWANLLHHPFLFFFFFALVRLSKRLTCWQSLKWQSRLWSIMSTCKLWNVLFITQAFLPAVVLSAKRYHSYKIQIRGFMFYFSFSLDSTVKSWTVWPILYYRKRTGQKELTILNLLKETDQENRRHCVRFVVIIFFVSVAHLLWSLLVILSPVTKLPTFAFPNQSLLS